MNNIRAVSILVVVAIAIVATFQLSGRVIDSQKPVRIGYIPLVMSLPLYVAEANKYFESEGISYELVKMDSSQQLVDSILSGGVDVAFEASSSPVLAAASRNPDAFKVFSVSLKPEGSFDPILVSKDSPIGNLLGLEGRKIGVPYGTVFTKLLKHELSAGGVDAEKSTFIQIGSADQEQALKSGFVDALYTFEPTASILSQGYKARTLASSVFGQRPQGLAVLSSEFVSNNPEAAKKVVAVFDKSVDFINSDSSSARSIASYRLNIPAYAANAMPLFKMSKSAEIDINSLEQFSKLLVDLKEADGPVDTSKIVYK